MCCLVLDLDQTHARKMRSVGNNIKVALKQFLEASNYL